jgi:hypothetical protein
MYDLVSERRDWNVRGFPGTEVEQLIETMAVQDRDRLARRLTDSTPNVSGMQRRRDLLGLQELSNRVEADEYGLFDQGSGRLHPPSLRRLFTQHLGVSE